MTYCAKRNRYGQEERCLPSGFIKEIPSRMYEYVDYEKLMKEPVSQDEQDDFFASIRSMLADD